MQPMTKRLVTPMTEQRPFAARSRFHSDYSSTQETTNKNQKRKAENEKPDQNSSDNHRTQNQDQHGVVGCGPDRHDHAVGCDRPATVGGAYRHPAGERPGG